MSTSYSKNFFNIAFILAHAFVNYRCVLTDHLTSSKHCAKWRFLKNDSGFLTFLKKTYSINVNFT